jgi:DNA primase
MINLSIVTDFIYENCENVTISKNGTHFYCRCPICGDSKKSQKKKRFHLQYVDERNIFYHCWNCDDSGNFYKLYAFIKHITTEDAYKELRKFNKETIEKSLKPLKIEYKENVFREKIETFNYLSEDCIDENYNGNSLILENYKNKLLEFKEKRKIPDNISLSVAYKGKYKNRIIIKIVDDEKNIIYFQARAMFPNMEPKYINPPVEKEKVIEESLIYMKNQILIITEGIIDAYSLPGHGISCLGKEINEDLLNIMLENNNEVIIAMDNDKSGYNSIKNILRYSNAHKIKYFLFPKEFKQVKDLNELLVLNYNINIFDFVIKNSFNKFETEVKLRMENWRFSK